MPEMTLTSWRDYRTLSPKQRLMMDFITRKGRFKKIGGRRRYGLYGGAGWGGKSWLLRSAAFEICMDMRDQGCPNQWVTIYTKTYPDLEDRHLRELDKEFSGIGTYSDSNRYGYHMKWNVEGMGGVFFRNIESASSTSRGGGKKPGAKSIGALIDELTELEYDEFAGINYVTRPGAENVPYVPILTAANPDGVGHKFVKEIFVPKYRKLSRNFFKNVSKDDILFIQAFKHDNPAYEQQKDVIDAIFSMIEDEDIRKAREEGSWDLYASGRFSNWNDKVHGFVWDDLYGEYGIPYDLSPADFVRDAHFFGFTAYGSLDYGTSEKSVSAYYVHLVGPDGRPWTIARLRMSGMELEDQAAKIGEFEAELGCSIRTRFADPSLWGKDKKKDQYHRAERFRRTPQRLLFQAGVNDRVEGAATVAYLLGWQRGVDGVVLRAPRWRVHRGELGWPGCPELMEQIPDLPRDPDNPEDVDPRDGINHDYDSVRYFLHTRFKGGAAKERTTIKRYSAAYFDRLREADEKRNRGDYLS